MTVIVTKKRKNKKQTLKNKQQTIDGETNKQTYKQTYKQATKRTNLSDCSLVQLKLLALVDSSVVDEVDRYLALQPNRHQQA